MRPPVARSQTARPGASGSMTGFAARVPSGEMAKKSNGFWARSASCATGVSSPVATSHRVIPPSSVRAAVTVEPSSAKTRSWIGRLEDRIRTRLGWVDRADMRLETASCVSEVSAARTARSAARSMSSWLATDWAASWRDTAMVRWLFASCSFRSAASAGLASARCSSATLRCCSARVAFCSAVLRWRRAKPARTRATTRPPESSAVRIRAPRRSDARLARTYEVWSGVGRGSRSARATACSARPRSRPRSSRLRSRPEASQSRARVTSRVCSLTHSRSVSSAPSSRANPASKSSPSRRVSQL